MPFRIYFYLKTVLVKYSFIKISSKSCILILTPYCRNPNIGLCQIDYRDFDEIIFPNIIHENVQVLMNLTIDVFIVPCS